MRNKGLLAVLFGLALILAPSLQALGAPGGNGKGRGKNGGKTVTVKQGVEVSPTALSSPVTTQSGMEVCVAGFTEGNYVSVSVPWWGSPDQHTVLGYGQYIDASGGFCVKPPPDWTEMNLEPGTYTLKTIWNKDGYNSDYQFGPETTFEVFGN